MRVPYTCKLKIFTLEKSTTSASRFNGNISTASSTVSTNSRTKVSHRAKKRMNRQIIQSEAHWTDEWIRCETDVESNKNLEKARKLL